MFFMILVTGATGLLGSELISKLLKKKLGPIRAVYHEGHPEPPILPGLSWVAGDITNPVSCYEIIKGVDLVYHCAGAISYEALDKEKLWLNNQSGTANIVNACLEYQVKKLIHVSSVAVLTSEGSILNEEMFRSGLKFKSPYGQSKFLAEMEVWRGIAEGLNAAIVNPAIILGSGDWSKGSSAIFHLVYKGFPWYSEGRSGFVDVLDVVEAMMDLMESNISSARFILCGANMSFKDLFSSIAENFGKEKPSKKASRWIASLLWRYLYLQAKLTHRKPVLTKQTVSQAFSSLSYDGSLITKTLPSFSYTPIENSIKRICLELKNKYHLS